MWLVFLVIAIYYLNESDELETKVKNLKKDLGKPLDLKYINQKLNTKDAVCVINKFVVSKDQANPKEMSAMRIGVGLLSHHDYPHNPIYFKMVFQWGEEIVEDAKTTYVVVPDKMSGILHLRKC